MCQPELGFPATVEEVQHLDDKAKRVVRTQPKFIVSRPYVRVVRT
jgi:hypothetical protein